MADGYARASGKVGVAVATSGPGATNLTTGIANAMLDSIPTVFITGQVPSQLLGSDAFQETDVTGITLPITKHNALVTDVRDLARTMREAFAIARGGRPGPCSWTSARTRSRRRPSSCGPRRVDLPGLQQASRSRRRRTSTRAAELIAKAERPVDPGRPRRDPLRLPTQALMAFAERTARRWPSPCSGLGGFPAEPPALPRHDGHARRGLRQHRDPAGRPAARLRHALRRPGHRQPQDLRAQRQEDPRRDRPLRESARTWPVDVALVATCAPSSRRSPPRSPRSSTTDWLARDRRRAAGDPRARHPPPARRRQAATPPTSSTTCGRPPRATRSS